MYTSVASPIEQDMVQVFIRGLTLPLCLASKKLIAFETTFPQVVGYAKTIEQAYLETYGGGGKSPCYK